MLYGLLCFFFLNKSTKSRLFPKQNNNFYKSDLFLGKILAVRLQLGLGDESSSVATPIVIMFYRYFSCAYSENFICLKAQMVKKSLI